MFPQESVEQADFLIIGGGIAGASAGYWLARHGRVILLEREAQPGYHSTGRSAALFAECYGPPQVRALTMASRAFFERPPENFAEHPLLAPARGALFVATQGLGELLDEHWRELHTVNSKVQFLAPEEAIAMVPVLRPEKAIGAVFDPGVVVTRSRLPKLRVLEYPE